MYQLISMIRQAILVCMIALTVSSVWAQDGIKLRQQTTKNGAQPEIYNIQEIDAALTSYERSQRKRRSLPNIIAFVLGSCEFVRKRGIYEFFRKNGGYNQGLSDFIEMKPTDVINRGPTVTRGRVGDRMVELHKLEDSGKILVFKRTKLSETRESYSKVDVIDYYN